MLAFFRLSYTADGGAKSSKRSRGTFPFKGRGRSSRRAARRPKAGIVLVSRTDVKNTTQRGDRKSRAVGRGRDARGGRGAHPLLQRGEDGRARRRELARGTAARARLRLRQQLGRPHGGRGAARGRDSLPRAEARQGLR